MRRFLELLGHLSNSITIATWAGLPITLGAGLAAAWAYAQKMGPLTAVLVFCFIFVSLLWGLIGIFWLFDRVTPGGRKTLDSSWGLVTDSGFITFSPGHERYCQVSINVRNMLNWPIRVEAEDLFMRAENRLPDQDLAGDFRRVIVHQNAVLTLNLRSYSKEAWPDVKAIHGKIRITCHYGHPDGGHTRTMKRWFEFEQPSYSPPPGFASEATIIRPHSVKLPLNFGAEQDDVDIPYVKAESHKSPS